MTPFIRESVKLFASAGVDPTELAWFDPGSDYEWRCHYELIIPQCATQPIPPAHTNLLIRHYAP